MDPHRCLEQATTVLEWTRLLDIVAGQAGSSRGKEHCRRLPLETDLETARIRLQETAEWLALGDGTDPFPSLRFPDVRDLLTRASKGAVLEPHDLRDLGLVLHLVDEVTRYLARHVEEAPALAALAAPLEAAQTDERVEALRVAIDRCVDAEGNIRHSATPKLRELMAQSQDLKQTMRHRLDHILASKRYAEILQERYFAQREGRCVSPVKAEMQGKVPGIVHDVSASGATVFLEPRELVELNNAIKVAEREVDREVRRILQDLSAQVAPLAPVVGDCGETLAQLDGVGAKAGFSRMVQGRAVRLNADGRVLLRHARHPLLVLARERVVPNDVILDESVRVLVISGPNTGGKTVTLKILGLFALMVRAGLQPPCGADSEMALFQEVYADIGDAQDLTKDLSSFSAHITQMVELLNHAATRSSFSSILVLLDEPVTSTDPAEGAALAEALLRRFADLGLKVVVTTHYTSLKVLAQSTPGFLNASVEFDIGTLSPTYRLITGIPGGSSAIEIAGRLGMDEALLDQALGLLRREDRTLERILGELQERQRRLDDQAARLGELRRQAEEAAREVTERLERLRQGEREARQGVKQQLTAELLRARAEVQTVLEELKRERTLARAKEAKQRLARLGTDAQAHLVKPDELVPIDALKAGDAVEIQGLGLTGVLTESPQDKKRVRVRVGDAELSVGVRQLTGLGKASQDPFPRGTSGRMRPASRSGVADRQAQGQAEAIVDLRGRTVEEAIEQTIAALDRAALIGTPWIRIIHGHGTGRLKVVLRDYLQSSPYVARFRPGERVEGGDGVTIVELATS